MSPTDTNSNRLTVQGFLKCLRQSRLLAPADWEQLNAEFLALATAGTVDAAQQVAAQLIQRGVLTSWQAAKLLQGKHRSFHLGKYKLLGLVGKGGMSTVYLAEHRLMKRRCALKVLPSRRVRDSSWLGRFHREAQVGASLDHPNIIRTYDVDSVKEGEAEVHFIVMEYVDGEDLRRLVDRDGPLDSVTAADYIRQVADALEHAHAAGLVHRDIKPANILLDGNGVIRLMDLGLVTATQVEDEASLTRAHNEQVIGTADYLSPEQALDSHLVDPRADLYGLGCTLYFLLTGRPPFHEGTLAQRILAHQTKQPEPLKNLVPGLSPDLESIVTQMMRKRPDERFQTARDVADALTQWLVEQGALPDAPLETRPVRQRSTPAAETTAAADDTDLFPVAEPVIPNFAGVTAVSDSAALPVAAAVVASVVDGVEPGHVAAVDDVAGGAGEIHVTDYPSAIHKGRAGSGDRWLLGIAVAMLVGLAVLAVVAIVSGL